MSTIEKIGKIPQKFGWKSLEKGSGYGSVGRVAASDYRGTRFQIESSAKIYIEHFTVNWIEKKNIKEKRRRMAHFF